MEIQKMLDEVTVQFHRKTYIVHTYTQFTPFTVCVSVERSEIGAQYVAVLVEKHLTICIFNGFDLIQKGSQELFGSSVLPNVTIRLCFCPSVVYECAKQSYRTYHKML